MMANIRMALVAAGLATIGGCAVIELAQDNGSVTMEVLDDSSQK